MSIEFAHNDDVHLAYETFGDVATGKPLLLVMGLDFQMVWWPDAFCRMLVDHGYAVVRFDNRDTGLSTHFSSPAKQNPFRALAGGTKPVYTGDDMIADGFAVMDAVGWHSAHVMGGSMGSAIAQGMALRQPDRVRSLIAAMSGPATAGVLQTFRNINFGIFAKFARLPKATTREQEIENLVSIYRIISSPGYPFPEQWARQAATISHDRHPRDPRTTQRQLAAGRAIKLPPLSSLKLPTLVLAGEDDPLIKLRAARQLAAQIPGSTFVSYQGMGHSMPEELWPEIIARISCTTGR